MAGGALPLHARIVAGLVTQPASTVVWFRQDLRVADNPALSFAAAHGPVIPLYVLDETPAPGGRPLGAASRWWLHGSLERLATSLGGLLLLRGEAAQLVPEVVRRTGARRVVWNRCYEPYAVERDQALKARLTATGVQALSFNGSLLFEPWEIRTGEGGPFRVYSPFWRACMKRNVPAPPERPAVRPSTANFAGDSLSSWGLRPVAPDWAAGFAQAWSPGEAGAQRQLREFLSTGLNGYAEFRDHPQLPHVSRLSPHLHFGELSPRQVWSATRALLARRPALLPDADKFLAELGWREFAAHLLYHFPNLPTCNWRQAFDTYPWAENPAHLRAWQKGETGYPLVDAGMRELWRTGYMHNRVRMIAASFLVKHLRLHWREGESWFWDTLVDADLANNVAGWQWVAGSGADAAPYFRIFNPIEQGRRFDPAGAYVRKWCPEIAALGNAHIHAPFAAPAQVLRTAGIVLGRTYPAPLVDHAQARTEALAGYRLVQERSRGKRGAPA
ncbi:MAG: deoxyribodipyrimidine photo-lyase [Gammaproteobacteria bacterium]|nr:deoxyribodipyrimidine photo-lyase [Gammaproteobacteria bacterium]